MDFEIATSGRAFGLGDSVAGVHEGPEGEGGGGGRLSGGKISSNCKFARHLLCRLSIRTAFRTAWSTLVRAQECSLLACSPRFAGSRKGRGSSRYSKRMQRRSDDPDARNRRRASGGMAKAESISRVGSSDGVLVCDEDDDSEHSFRFRTEAKTMKRPRLGIRSSHMIPL